MQGVECMRNKETKGKREEQRNWQCTRLAAMAGNEIWQPRGSASRNCRNSAAELSGGPGFRLRCVDLVSSRVHGASDT